MVPNLQVGDRVAVSKFAYGYSKHSVPLGLGKYLPLGDGRLFASQPKRGDVVVFRHPHADKVMIKRLIGLPGDTVQMAGVRVVINGKPLEQETQREVRYHEARRGALLRADEKLETTPEGESYLIHQLGSGNRDSNIFKVPEGHFLFMGDNRDNSTDGRALSGHCPKNENNVIDEAGCKPEIWRESEASIGYVPFDLLIGRADTVLFTLNFCNRYESGCPKGRVWKSL